jgi:hypothetical protein
MLEMDHEKMISKVDSAENVLRSYLGELDSSAKHFRERQRISDALRTLEMIRSFELKRSA